MMAVDSFGAFCAYQDAEKEKYGDGAYYGAGYETW
jgi:hypothetical protein